MTQLVPGVGRVRPGFTVTELLVVIGILVVLLSLLVPGLRLSREHANITVCASTLKDIGNITLGYMMDHAKRYPSYYDLEATYPATTLRCPNDYDPLLLPVNSVNNTRTITLSFGQNTEYNSKPNDIYNLDRTPSPVFKAMFFDGGRSTSDILIANGPGQPNSPSGSAKKGKDGKVTIVHFANQKELSVSVNALPSHLAHGDVLGGLPSSGPLSIASVNKNDFNPRHPLYHDAGNILFADTHVAAYRQMDNTMFLFP